jgi:hypothetical protein
MVHAKWTPLEPPANECKRFQRDVCEGYGHWLTQVNGLSRSTLRKNVDAARLFLLWLKEHGGPETPRRLNVSDLDAYLAWRMPELRAEQRERVQESNRRAAAKYRTKQKKLKAEHANRSRSRLSALVSPFLAASPSVKETTW